MFGKVRKARSDRTVGIYEKKHDLPPEPFKTQTEERPAKTKKLETLRKETGKDFRR